MAVSVSVYSGPAASAPSAGTASLRISLSCIAPRWREHRQSPSAAGRRRSVLRREARLLLLQAPGSWRPPTGAVGPAGPRHRERAGDPLREPLEGERAVACLRALVLGDRDHARPGAREQTRALGVRQRAEAPTSKIASTREAVTFACWPPGPEERLVRSVISDERDREPAAHAQAGGPLLSPCQVPASSADPADEAVKLPARAACSPSGQRPSRPT